MDEVTRPEDIRIARPETLAHWDGMGGWSPPRDAYRTPEKSRTDGGLQMDAWKEAMKPTITAPASAGVSEAEIALINRVKAKAKEVGALVVEIEKVSMGHPVPASVEIGLDHRWLAIGRTDLQKGFMAVIRAIARPEGF